jgi:hypothetical protein
LKKRGQINVHAEETHETEKCANNGGIFGVPIAAVFPAGRSWNKSTTFDFS